MIDDLLALIVVPVLIGAIAAAAVIAVDHAARRLANRQHR